MSPAAAHTRRGLLFWAPFAVFALLGVLWALASPVFSVPDENAHAFKAIAQVRGQVVGYTLHGVKHLVVDLPEGYEYDPAITCFATYPDEDASCGGAALGDDAGVDWFNTWVGGYNPVYYYLVGWPSRLVEGNAGVYAMRVASAVLGATMLAWAFQAGALGRRSRWMPLGVAFAAMPMCVYLIGAVNPNGAEIAAAVALWVGVLRLLESFGARSKRPFVSRTWLWAGVTASSLILVTARALGPLWLVIIVATCMIASGWSPVRQLFTRRSSYGWIAVIAVGGLFSVGWTLASGSLSSQAEASDAPLVNGTFVEGFAYMLGLAPFHVQQALGIFGWLDTPLPAWAYWLPIAALAVTVVLALTGTTRRSAFLLAGLLAAAVLLPALVQGYSVHQTGIIWQGRYALFLYLGIAIVAAWLLSIHAPRLTFLAPRIAWLGGALLAAFGLVAFGRVLVRYVIADAPLTEMFSAPQWQPPLGWLTLAILYAVASAALVAVVGVATATVASREGAADTAEPTPVLEAPAS